MKDHDWKDDYYIDGTIQHSCSRCGMLKIYDNPGRWKPNQENRHYFQSYWGDCDESLIQLILET